MYSSQLRTPYPRSEAARLNYLLFEVVAIATPHVAYSFVTKKPVWLHTFDRAGRMPTPGEQRSRSCHAVHACASRPRSMARASAILSILVLGRTPGRQEPHIVPLRGMTSAVPRPSPGA